MCGIIGYLGKDEFITHILNGLWLLINRGYDSVGISTIIDNSLNTIKYANDESMKSLETKINEVEYKTNIGIGHTRWATHGAKTTLNAHPHHDNRSRISLVHNGIIENYAELKAELLADGYYFLSQTDTEVIAVLIGKYLDTGLCMMDAVETTINRLSGTWALVILNAEFPNKLWITRNGSPLLLGMEEEFIMVASEQIAFGNNIKQYIVLDNHDIFEIERDIKTNKITYNRDIRNYILKTKVEQGIINIRPPQGYEHWMKKEIYEQDKSVKRAINNGGRIKDSFSVKLGGLDSHLSDLKKIDHLVLLGCGTSYHAGLWALQLFKSLSIFLSVTIYDGAEFTINDIVNHGKSGIIFLSQSGETKDLHRCLDIVKNSEYIRIGVVNVVDSMIARETDCGIYLNAGREVAVASTKSFTNQCLILGLIAIWFSQIHSKNKERRNHIIKDCMNLSIQIKEVLENKKIIRTISEIVDKWYNQPSMFLLGKGNCEAIAREGALKIKEVTYIHAEGYSSSALKHGPFALIIPGLPIIIVDIGKENREKNQNAIEEVLSRGADIWVLTDNLSYEKENITITYLPENNSFGSLIATIIIQLFSYELAIKKCYNPDYPRNLAKVVTVE